MGKERPLLKITISGPGVKPGRISLPILQKICQEAQEAVNRQAQAIEAKVGGKPASEVVVRECTLELIALKKGSTTLDFGPASKQLSLLPEMQSLGFDAVNAVATTLRAVSKARGKWKPPDPDVLDALDELGGIFKEGVKSLKWIAPSQNGHKTTTAEFVPATHRKLKRRKQESLPLESSTPLAPTAEGTSSVHSTSQVPIQESFLEGMLEVAGGSVRITPLIGAPAVISYGADKAETVLEAMHKPVRVKLDKQGGHKLVDIEITAEMDTGTASFFTPKSIDQLIAEQHIHPITDISVLGGAIPDEDLDEFVAEIYRDRKV